MESKNRMLLCTDDITPESVKKYWTYWEVLKESIPHLKLNAFVIPHFRRVDSELITSSFFKKWYKGVSSWVSLHLHGYDHSYPPECVRSYPEQLSLITLGKSLLEQITSTNFGFKAPGYYITNDTKRVLSDSAFSFVCHKHAVEFFRKPKQNFHCQLFQSHTNEHCQDSITKIYNSILELRHNQFVTFEEII